MILGSKQLKVSFLRVTKEATFFVTSWYINKDIISPLVNMPVFRVHSFDRLFATSKRLVHYEGKSDMIWVNY